VSAPAFLRRLVDDDVFVRCRARLAFVVVFAYVVLLGILVLAVLT
jgi:hypothetical protein